MTLPPPEVYQQIFASWLLFGAPDWTEADRIRLFGLLAKHGLSINDLPQTFLAVNVTAAPEAYPFDSGRSIGSGSWRKTALWGARRLMMSR